MAAIALELLPAPGWAGSRAAAEPSSLKKDLLSEVRVRPISFCFTVIHPKIVRGS